MWDVYQINRAFNLARIFRDDVMFMAAKVALMNFNNYGPLTPEQVEAIKKSWGEE